MKKYQRKVKPTLKSLNMVKCLALTSLHASSSIKISSDVFSRSNCFGSDYTSRELIRL